MILPQFTSNKIIIEKLPTLVNYESVTFAGKVCIDAAGPQRQDQQPTPGGSQPSAALDLQNGRG